MRSDKDARPVRAAHASSSPAPARETGELSPVWRLIGAALALLCLLLLVWTAGHVHPEIASVSAAPRPSAAPGSPAPPPAAALALHARLSPPPEHALHLSAP